MKTLAAPPPGGLRYLLASAIGGFLGLCLSFMVTGVVVSVFTSVLAAVYFGILFFLLGAGILVRLQFKRARQVALGVFGVVAIISGFACLALRPEWLHAGFWRIVYASLIAVSSSFVCTFLVVDAVTVVHDYTVETQHDLIDTARQVNLIMFGSVVLGLLCGVTYGAVDLDSLSAGLRTDLAVVLPLGSVLGALLSFTNESLRARDLEQKYVQLNSMQAGHDDGV
jgi:hypothetical protein